MRNKRKSKLKNRCLIIGIVLITGAAFLTCMSDPAPDVVTTLGILVWLEGHDVDLNELDTLFLEIEEGLDYGPLPSNFELHIKQATCNESKCYFKMPPDQRKLAGLFKAPDRLYIHLANGDWTLRQSAYKHEIIHYAKLYYFNDPDADHSDSDWNLQRFKKDEVA